MWTDTQIINQLGPKRAEELLRYTEWALVCEGCDRKVAAQFLWRNATSVINEGVAELEAADREVES